MTEASEEVMTHEVGMVRSEFEMHLHLHQSRLLRLKDDVKNVRAAEFQLHRERIASKCARFPRATFHAIPRATLLAFEPLDVLPFPTPSHWFTPPFFTEPPPFSLVHSRLIGSLPSHWFTPFSLVHTLLTGSRPSHWFTPFSLVHSFLTGSLPPTPPHLLPLYPVEPSYRTPILPLL
jgi:hypothetical protein